MGERRSKTNLSRNLRSMKFMRRAESAIDLDAEAAELKTRPEQWFREVQPLEVKFKEDEDISIAECMGLRWGRASYGGFNKPLERLAERMNRPEGEEEDDLGEDVSAMEMIKRARENADRVNYDNDTDEIVYEPLSKKKKRQLEAEDPEPEDDTMQFKRPE
ncbi:Oidioi.mRNA.OKI2018_I69.chr1.g3835.t1.cds [Oikopleura dioica]|uniref:Oidioi.mRNA.OKI2018_I69.chr1.g3835.t1.cds n=1 Tax=Oikopleura dioica TaxID=34765 RepID=A0ABN7SV99_OIKDI|nr:Oidioi.mRNA.OKI2018_I69.chr1.g3835.t1.cds [Oikopleura dioica]